MRRTRSLQINRCCAQAKGDCRKGLEKAANLGRARGCRQNPQLELALSQGQHHELGQSQALGESLRPGEEAHVHTFTRIVKQNASTAVSR